MARSSRPELVKDNPAAPQMYVRRRSKRRPLRPFTALDAGGRDDLRDTLRTLTEAAEDFLQAAPQRKRAKRARQVLLDAIAQAQSALSEVIADSRR